MEYIEIGNYFWLKKLKTDRINDFKISFSFSILKCAIKPKDDCKNTIWDPSIGNSVSVSVCGTLGHIECHIHTNVCVFQSKSQ